MCLSVCLLVLFMSPAKTTDPIEMLFNRLTRPKAPFIIWGSRCLPQGVLFGGQGILAVVLLFENRWESVL